MLSSLVFSLLMAQASHEPLHTPYAKAEPVSIGGVRLSAPEVPRLGVEEIDVDAHGTYDNPFDAEDVSLEARVTGPSGKTLTVPGFLYRPYKRELKNGKEVLTPDGSPKWQLRIAPIEEGSQRVEITFRDRNGAASKSVTFRAAKEAAPGMIRVSPRDRRFFEFDDGTSYYPVGTNVCWGNDPGTFSYDDWFAQFGKVGANYARLWLSPSWTTFAMDVPGKTEEGKGMGQFDLGNAWRLDHVVDLAKQNGIYLQFCLESYNILRDKDAANWWEKTPHNQDNGGPLRIWTDFWTSEEMDRLFKMKLRYLVARYGAESNLMAWEMWNEVDLTRDFDTTTVRDWHQRMAGELHKIDPYQHLVTTSVSDTMGNRDLELIPELDYYQTHLYNAPDLAGAVVAQQSRKQWGRPHFIGEIGADASGPRAADDPNGLQIHDPIWASIATGVAGTASPWWWDNLTAPNHLYPLFGAAAKFVKGIDWPAEAFQLEDLTFAYQNAPKARQFRDLNLDSGPVSWSAGPANRRQTLSVSSLGYSGDAPLSGILHGVRNHPDLHNPVLFKVEAPRPTRFDVIVGDVSGYGGATLRVEMDGGRVMTRNFADPDDAKDPATLKKYAGRYSITIPKGYHTVKVENVGADWFMVSYRFAGLLPRTKPPVEGWAIVGNDTLLGWFRAEGRTWARVDGAKETIPGAPASVFGVAGLPAGKWSVEYWDTWKGTITSTATVTVSNVGKARVPLPPIQTDLAIKMRRVGHP